MSNNALKLSAQYAGLSSAQAYNDSALVNLGIVRDNAIYVDEHLELNSNELKAAIDVLSGFLNAQNKEIRSRIQAVRCELNNIVIGSAK